MSLPRFALTGLLLAQCLCAQGISADSLRGNLSFLSSDLLQGRATPSPGLEIAADFIASQFRRAGIEPYFQTANLVEEKMPSEGIRVTLHIDGHDVEVPGDRVRARSSTALNLTAATIEADPEDSKKKIVVLKSGARLGIAPRTRGLPQSRLIDPALEPASPTLYLPQADFEKIGSTTTLDLNLPAPERTSIHARNVIGLLRGSDPELRDTYVVVSAHYDHLGPHFNGANDDASGTVSVIELAYALAAMPQRPKRSILFIAFFGEERGLIGSRYYVNHPVFPLDKTVADVNLEQLGRLGEPKRIHITGLTKSNIPGILEQAASKEGVTVDTEDKLSERFFTQSDNYSFAEKGIPAHTIAVTYEFPDYHAEGDDWQKIDYQNMAQIVRAVEAGVLALTSAPLPPPGQFPAAPSPP